MSVAFFVPGRPVPQGSKKGFVVKGRAVLVDVNKTELRAWRASVVDIVHAVHADTRFEEAVEVRIEFAFERPASVTRRYPSVAPDIDKLARALLDGLTDSGLLKDDSLVVHLDLHKVYASQPGALVTVGPMAAEKE